MPVPGRTFLVGGHHGHEDAVGGLLRHERAQQPPWPRKQVLVLNNQKVFGLEKKYQRRDLVEGQEAPVVGAMGRRGDASGDGTFHPNFGLDELWRPRSATKFFFAGAAKGMVATSAKNAMLHLLTFSVFLFYRCAV